ncbi:MAG: FAD:protein FMN transferase [Actinomycetota bacterium]
MNHTFPTMGTMASLDLSGEPFDAGPVEAVFDEYDRTFSLYRADSELSRIASGELRLTDASEVVRSAFADANDWRALTAGAFTPNRPDGVVDLDGIVKALAIERAGLELAGLSRWCLNVGGDVLVAPGSEWTIGIVDPVDRTRLLCSILLAGSRRAVATSGIGERGEHIWRTTSASPEELVQVTVIADDIVTADVLATAILSGGTAFADIATARWPIDLITVSRADAITMTPGARSALAS